MVKSSTTADIFADIDDQFAKPCETPDGDCTFPATCVVWCDHHSLGCDYSGFRCDIHRNMLLLETRRMVEHLRKGGEAMCGRCSEWIVGNNMEDHVRWMPL